MFRCCNEDHSASKQLLRRNPQERKKASSEEALFVGPATAKDRAYYQHDCRFVLVTAGQPDRYARTREGAEKAAAAHAGTLVCQLVEMGSEIRHGGRADGKRELFRTWQQEAVEAEAEAATEEEQVQEELEQQTQGIETATEAALQGTPVQAFPDGSLVACGVDVKALVRQYLDALGCGTRKMPYINLRFCTSKLSSGHVKNGRNYMVLSIGVDCTLADLMALVLHECTHLWHEVKPALRKDRVKGVHGMDFRRKLCDTALLLWGVQVDPSAPDAKGQYGCDWVLEKKLKALGTFTTLRNAGLAPKRAQQVARAEQARPETRSAANGLLVGIDFGKQGCVWMF